MGYQPAEGGLIGIHHRGIPEDHSKNGLPGLVLLPFIAARLSGCTNSGFESRTVSED